MIQIEIPTGMSFLCIYPGPAKTEKRDFASIESNAILENMYFDWARRRRNEKKYK